MVKEPKISLIFKSGLLAVLLLVGVKGWGQTTDLIISEYGEGSSGNSKYIEIYNGTGASVDLSNYRIWTISNGGSWPEATINLSGTLPNNTSYVIANNSTDVPGANLYSGTCSWNGDDAVGLSKNTGSWTLIDAVGEDGADPGTGWAVAGIANATVDRRLTRKSSVCSPNIDWTVSRGTDASNSEWIVSAAYTTGAANAGHSVTCSSCADPTTQASSVTFGSITQNSMTVSWTRGGTPGDGVIVVGRAGAAPVDPVDNTNYTANAAFGSGTDCGSGSYVVFMGSGTSVNVTGLTASTTYYFEVFEKNCTGTSIKINTTSPTSGNQTTSAPPALSPCPTDLIISEYVEGNSNNKFIEIANFTGFSVDLSDYKLQLYANGSGTPSNDVTLSGTLADGAVVVYENSSEALGVAGISNAACNFNGDDAVALYKISTSSFVDIFGRIGEDPGTAWTSASNSTLDKTLVRKSSVTSGVTTNPASGFPTLESEWTQYSIDDVSNLGSHTITCGCSAPTTQATSLASSLVYSTQMTISWTNGNGSKRVVKMNTVNAFTDPVNGTDPSANSTYSGAGEQVVYNGTGNSVLITGLTAGTTYWFRVYEANCSSTSVIYLTTTASGNPASATTGFIPPPVPTVLVPGDLAVVGVNANNNLCSGLVAEDIIHFVCFKDISTGTAIDFTDNGWERSNAGFWGNTEGTIRATRTGAIINAGTVITFRANSAGTITCTYPDNNWTFDELSNSFNLNSGGDQLFFMQGGAWNNGTSGSHNATYTGGNILFAFNTRTTWAADGSTQQSNLPLGMDCFSMNPTSGATDFIKYTGPMTLATQIEWIGRINDPTYWTNYASCATYNAALPNYEGGVTLPISSTGIDPTHNWYGAKNTEWFDCANWGTLRVPAATDHVVIPNSTNVKRNIELIAGENAQCQNLTLNHPSYEIRAGNGATKLLTINGNLTINAGALRFDDGNNGTTDGTIYIKGNWINNTAASPFICGNSSVYFNGNAQSVQSPSLGYENFYNFNIVSPAVVNPGTVTLNISGAWNNYNSSGFTENTSEVVFNGSGIQTIATTGGETFYNLTVNNSAAGISLSVPVTVTSTLNQQNGYVALNAQTLTLNGNLNRTNGVFRGTTSSILTINGAGVLNAGLMFEAAFRDLATLTINRPAGTAIMLSSLEIWNSLNITQGILSLNGSLLALRGVITGTGTISSTALSSLFIRGAGNAGTLYLTANADTIGTFSTSRTSGNIILGSPVMYVATLLQLQEGIVTTNSNRIVVLNTNSNAITLYNPSGYVNGILRRHIGLGGYTMYDFPVGTASNYEFCRLDMSFGPPETNRYIEVFFSNPHSTPLDLSSYNLWLNGTQITTLLDYGYWSVTNNISGSVNYDITLTSRGHTNGGTVASQHTIVKRTNILSNWEVFETNHNNGTQTGTGTNPVTAKLSGMTTFSHFAIARSAINPLPVELSTFTARTQGRSSLLNWSTLSETNNKGFDVLRSTDGTNFASLGWVNGAGFSSEKLDYLFVDPAPKTGYNYYKLLQNDYDGGMSESEVRSVFFTGNGQAVHVYSENGLLTVSGIDADSDTRIYVFDVTGREISIFTGTDADYQATVVPGQFYLIKIISAGSTEVIKTVAR